MGARGQPGATGRGERPDPRPGPSGLARQSAHGPRERVAADADVGLGVDHAVEVELLAPAGSLATDLGQRGPGDLAGTDGRFAQGAGLAEPRKRGAEREHPRDRSGEIHGGPTLPGFPWSIRLDMCRGT